LSEMGFVIHLNQIGSVQVSRGFSCDYHHPTQNSILRCVEKHRTRSRIGRRQRLTVTSSRQRQDRWKSLSPKRPTLNHSDHGRSTPFLVPSKRLNVVPVALAGLYLRHDTQGHGQGPPPVRTRHHWLRTIGHRGQKRPDLLLQRITVMHRRLFGL